MNIFVVEDDHDIRQMVCQSLKQGGFQTFACHDVQSARQSLEEYDPDCMVIDWMLPDGSGIELIRWLRRHESFRQVPILMLTAKAQENDMITGLDAGADDYLTKPMSLRELNARVRALLRRPSDYQEQKDTVRIGPVSLNSKTQEVHINETLVDLTRTEYKLLKLLVENPRKVFTREQILDLVWGQNAYLGDRTVDVHILRLRKILKPFHLDQMIATVRGSGYRLSTSAFD